MTNLLPEEAAALAAWKESTHGEWGAVVTDDAYGIIYVDIKCLGWRVFDAELERGEDPKLAADNAHAIALTHNIFPVMAQRLSEARGALEKALRERDEARGDARRFREEVIRLQKDRDEAIHLLSDLSVVASQRDAIAKDRDEYIHLLRRVLLIMCPQAMVPVELRGEWKASAETVLKDIFDLLKADTDLQMAKKL